MSKAPTQGVTPSTDAPPAYLVDVLSRAVNHLVLHGRSGQPVRFRYWHDGQDREYLAHLEWPPADIGPYVIVSDARSGHVVCWSERADASAFERLDGVYVDASPEEDEVQRALWELQARRDLKDKS